VILGYLESRRRSKKKQFLPPGETRVFATSRACMTQRKRLRNDAAAAASRTRDDLFVSVLSRHSARKELKTFPRPPCSLCAHHIGHLHASTCNIITPCFPGRVWPSLGWIMTLEEGPFCCLLAFHGQNGPFSIFILIVSGL